MTPSQSEQRTADEAELRQLINAWAQDLQNRDLDSLMQRYAAEISLFDCKPPVHIKGLAAYRAMWEACLAHLPKHFRSEHRDVEIVVDGDVAFAYGFHRLVSTDAPAEAERAMPPLLPPTWFRFTVGFRRMNGEWRAVHEHVSLPFDPRTGQVVFIPKLTTEQPNAT